MHRLHYYLRFLFGITRWEAYGIWTILFIFLLYIGFQSWTSQKQKIVPHRYLSLTELDWPKKSKSIKKNRVYSSSKAKRSTFVNNNHTFFTNRKRKEFSGVFDINTMDSIAWVNFPGIGPSLARRIILYREKLGGFYKVDQLKEVYGLDSNWVNQHKRNIQLGTGIFRKVKINQATWNEPRHPYLPYAQLNIFLKYKAQHGPIKNWQQLKEIILLDEKIWLRLQPYLSFD